VVTGFAKVQLA